MPGKPFEPGDPRCGRKKGSVGGRKQYFATLDTVYGKEHAKETWAKHHEYWMGYHAETLRLLESRDIDHVGAGIRLKEFKAYFDTYVAPFMPKNVEVDFSGGAGGWAAMIAEVKALQDEMAGTNGKAGSA